MKKLLSALFIFCAVCAWADITVDVFGESQIVHNDIASAKIQAEARAKWTAMEEAAQVKVNVSSVIHNAELLDEAVKSEVAGSITKYQLLDEGRDGDTYWLKARVTVKPGSASLAMEKLAKNSTIAVIVPMQKADGILELIHPFSQQLINDLSEEGFDVIDIYGQYPSIAEELDSAVSKKDMKKVRLLASKFMAGSVLIGTVKIIEKPQNVGYTKVNFSLVDASFNYQVYAEKDGKQSIVASSSVSARGQGLNPDLAAENASKNLAKNQSVIVAGNVASKVLGANKNSVRVVIVGNTDMHELQSFKEDVSNISWVLSVKERGTDTLIVDYAEKTYYLASIINKVTGRKIIKFTDSEILVGS